MLDDETFKELWRRVSTGTRYRVDFDSDQLVREAAQKVAAIHIQEVVVVSTRYGVTISLTDGVGGTVRDIQARRPGY